MKPVTALAAIAIVLNAITLPLACRKLSPHDLLSQPRHREHSDEGKYTKRSFNCRATRKDIRGRNGRQRFWIIDNRSEFLLCCIGEGGDSFNLNLSPTGGKATSTHSRWKTFPVRRGPGSEGNH